MGTDSVFTGFGRARQKRSTWPYDPKDGVTTSLATFAGLCLVRARNPVGGLRDVEDKLASLARVAECRWPAEGAKEKSEKDKHWARSVILVEVF